MTDLDTRSSGASDATSVSARRPRWSLRSLVIIGALVLGAGVAGWALGTASGDGDATTDAPIELPATIELWADAWMNRDADAFADGYEEDGRFDGVLGVGFAGRTEIRDGIEGYWPAYDAEVRLTAAYIFDDGSLATVVWDYEETSEDGSTFSDQRLVTYEWDWDDLGLFRSTSQNW